MKRWMQLSAVITVVLSGCYDGGQYGYAREYIPLDGEEDFFERAQDAVFNEVRTDPEAYRGIMFSWFGVVEQLDAGEGGSVVARLSFRTHQERHLCSEAEQETCRVTVSQASSGTFSAEFTPSSQDRQGRLQLGAGSLLRVYCNVTGDYDSEGGPLLRCSHYRHWPRGQWVHTGMRSSMRR